MSRPQKAVLVGGLFGLFLLIALHNPIGGYETWYVERIRGVTHHYSVLRYRSLNAIFQWVDEIGELLGLIAPLIIFTAITIRILKPRSHGRTVEPASGADG